MNFERARTKEQIQSRQEEIINACEKLFDKFGYEGVNFKAISELTSFTRPSIYNYYKTKDEILLDLLRREMEKWERQLSETLANNKSMSKIEYASFITDTLIKQNKMMKLFSILFTTLENNSSTEKLAEFKKKIMDLQSTFYESLSQYFPNASPENKMVFGTAFFSYILGLYPMTHSSQKQLDAINLAEIDYVAADFKDMCYRGILLLMSDL